MPNIPNLIAANGRRWQAMHFNTSRLHEFEVVSKSLIDHKAQYQEISDEILHLKNVRVPWGVIAVTDQREHAVSLGLCNSYLGNGQSLDRVTTIKPKNRGPFFSHPTDLPLRGAFFRGALDALVDVQEIQQWVKDHGASVPSWLTFLESLNGYGYANGPGGTPPMASPYLWGATSEQEVGKYVSDGVFSKSVWDPQLGCAGMLRFMSGLDSSVGFALPIVPLPIPVPTPVPVPVPTPPPIPTPVPTPVPVPIGDTMNAILQLVLGNPTLMGLLTTVISNPALVQSITQILTGLSSQVSTGVPPATAVQNLILTQFDLDGAAAIVEKEAVKLGPPPWNIDQQREMAALVIRSYIANVKAGK